MSGHARVYVAFDVLYRYLTARGYDVQYVRNFTDVDDKIIKRAVESCEEPSALSDRCAADVRAQPILASTLTLLKINRVGQPDSSTVDATSGVQL